MQTGVAPYLPKKLRSDSNDLRGVVRALEKRFHEMSLAQQGASDCDVDRGGSSAAGDTPGVPAAEYLG